MTAILSIYKTLSSHYGAQHWWPADTRFEVMVGAILTQNTAWKNVEQTLSLLKQHQPLDPESLLSTPDKKLAQRLRPSGYFNIKCQRLKNYCRWYISHSGYTALAQMDTTTLRQSLLAINGIGPETADDILLYAFERPVFVIDAYTRRIFSRLGLIDAEANYEILRTWFETTVFTSLCTTRGTRSVRAGTLVDYYNEYHALIVNHGKDICRPQPRCEQCCLRQQCTYAVDNKTTST